MSSSYRNRLQGMALCLLLAAAGSVQSADPASIPTICHSTVEGGNLVVVCHVRSGFEHAVLETRPDFNGSSSWTAHVSGSLNGQEGMVYFYAPDPGQNMIFRVKVGTETSVPAATYSGSSHFALINGLASCLFSEEERQGHLLNRIAYGPATWDLNRIDAIGLDGYLQEQLNPSTIDESDNTALNDRLAALYELHQPAEDTVILSSGEQVQYYKGTAAFPAGWMNPGFDDSLWETGMTGIGYGDEDDATELLDMPETYTTVLMRKVFNVEDTGNIDQLILSMDFDDGFVAFLNGVEVARANAAGPIAFDSTAEQNHEAGSPEEFDLTNQIGLLQNGANLLAIVGLNVSLTSSDFSLNPELISRKNLPLPAVSRIRGLNELQQLPHIRGIYSRRQLQAVLGEFWENHFTSDYDKVEDYFDDLVNSDGSDAMPESQARQEAAEVELYEHEFFYENALGNFGDLLLFHATSPAQLIYLDNVLNKSGQPNENYAREILELFGFGVDNRYTQTDIEQLARCFTGWTIRKVWPAEFQQYPDSSRNPPTEESVQFNDTPIVDLGSGWKYFNGLSEPSPVNGGQPGLSWTLPGFDDSAWTDGATPIGYGDVTGPGTKDEYYGTQIEGMRYNWTTVYLRRSFTVADPEAIGSLVLSAAYDDGFVAYLNGVEVARSRSMNDQGTPPAFDQTTSGGGREPIEPEGFNLNNFKDLLLPNQENVLAIHLVNISLSSSDIAIAPQLVERVLLPGSIENGDINGRWTFRFDPEEHDLFSKRLFNGTPQQIDIPADRTGIDGLLDATEVIDAMVDHPSTKEFIVIKLVNKFVSDEISLDSYHHATAPAELMQLVDNAIAAWDSTTPKGNISTVLQAILDPVARINSFWTETGYKSKIKTAVEYINSTVRAIDSDADTSELPGYIDDLAMNLFTRDDPDGWSEMGGDWMDSGTLLERIEFSRRVAGNFSDHFNWDTAGYLTANGIATAGEIVEHFNQKLFAGSLSDSNKALLLEFANTDVNGAASPLDPGAGNYLQRVRELVAVILSLPHWQYQ